MSDQAQQQDLGPELNLNLKLAEINFVLAALSKAPYEQVEGLISKIRQQAQAGIDAIQHAQEMTAPKDTQPQE